MRSTMRFLGLLALVGLVGAGVGVLTIVVLTFRYGINRSNLLPLGIIAASLLLGLIKRNQILSLVRYGVYGEDKGFRE